MSSQPDDEPVRPQWRAALPARTGRPFAASRERFQRRRVSSHEGHRPWRRVNAEAPRSDDLQELPNWSDVTSCAVLGLTCLPAISLSQTIADGTATQREISAMENHVRQARTGSLDDASAALLGGIETSMAMADRVDEPYAFVGRADRRTRRGA